jgi:hypothetical protein
LKIAQNFTTDVEECNFNKFNVSFVLSDKEIVLQKLGKNAKQVALDLENQKEMKKKLEETVIEQTKQYNELAKSLFNK